MATKEFGSGKTVPESTWLAAMAGAQKKMMAMRIKDEHAELPVPKISDTHVKETLRKTQTLKKQLALLTKKLAQQMKSCQHNYTTVLRQESNVGIGYEVGIFDSTLVCRKCGDTTVVKESPPRCTCCNADLSLVVWDGKLQKNATNSHYVDTWKTEYKRRRKLTGSSPLSYDLFFTQFGMYICTSKKCTRKGKAVFLVTGGD